MLSAPPFDTLYRQYYDKAFRFVKSYVKEDMATENLVSDGFLKLWETMNKEHVDNPCALLITILRHNALNYLKHQIIHLESIKDISTVLTRDLHYRIRSLEDCTPHLLFSKDIAEKLGLSPKSVEYHITQALKKLRIALQEYLPAK